MTRFIKIASLVWVFGWILAFSCMAQTTGPGELTFPTFGVRVTPPNGLTQVPEGGMGQVARWAKLNRSGHPDGVLTLEAEPSNGRTLRDWAAGTARKMQAQVLPQRSTLGSIEALHLKSDAKNPALHPDEAYACLKNGYIWVIASFTSSGWSDPAAVDQVRKSVRFMPPVAPSEQLALHREPQTIFQDISVNVPAIMRPLPSPQPNEQLQLGVWNYVTNHDEFSVVFDDVNVAVEGEAGAAQWVQSMSSAHKLEQPVAWHWISGSKSKIVTEPFVSKAGSPAEGETPIYFILGLARVSAHRTLLITATVVGKPEGGGKQYGKVITEIINSVEAHPKSN